MEGRERATDGVVSCVYDATTEEDPLPAVELKGPVRCEVTDDGEGDVCGVAVVRAICGTPGC